MDGAPGEGSDVANLLQQVRKEYEAAQLALTGFAYGASKHEFINQKMATIGKCREELGVLVGDKASIALIVEQLNAITDSKSSSI